MGYSTQWSSQKALSYPAIPYSQFENCECTQFSILYEICQRARALFFFFCSEFEFIRFCFFFLIRRRRRRWRRRLFVCRAHSRLLLLCFFDGTNGHIYASHIRIHILYAYNDVTYSFRSRILCVRGTALHLRCSHKNERFSVVIHGNLQMKMMPHDPPSTIRRTDSPDTDHN